MDLTTGTLCLISNVETLDDRGQYDTVYTSTLTKYVTIKDTTKIKSFT